MKNKNINIKNKSKHIEEISSVYILGKKITEIRKEEKIIYSNRYFDATMKDAKHSSLIKEELDNIYSNYQMGKKININNNKDTTKYRIKKNQTRLFKKFLKSIVVSFIIIFSITYMVFEHYRIPLVTEYIFDKSSSHGFVDDYSSLNTLNRELNYYYDKSGKGRLSNTITIGTDSIIITIEEIETNDKIKVTMKVSAKDLMNSKIVKNELEKISELIEYAY